MFPRGASDAKTRRKKLCRADATSDAIAGLFHADPEKAFVMLYLHRLVADGYAKWDVLENGDIQLSFQTGETFLLGRTMIIRIA